MRPSNAALAEAFSRHDFKAVYPYVADDIEWNIVGGQQLAGRDQLFQTCEESAKYLATVSTTFPKFRVISAGDCIVIDSLADYSEGGQGSSRVASCDIYQFDGDTLREITSYNVELASD